jgi:NAD(P)-dependent dehydrogenase (short-subunit alcohol dehydrogenase family)
MADLKRRIAVVAGASRGAGKGIALALGDAGATVYVAGRTSVQAPTRPDGAPGSIEETADEVSKRGGRGIAVRTDCTDEAQVAALFDRVAREQQRVDVLANAVWGGADGYRTMEELTAAWGKPFWQESPRMWHHTMNAGPYAYFLASTYAARMMAERGRGLIVGITDFYVGPEAEADDGMGNGQLLSVLAHRSINLLMKGMAGEARKKKIAVVTLMPGFMRTARVVQMVNTPQLKKQFGFGQSESTEYIGRAVAALAGDARVMTKSGKIHFVADLAREYGFTDIDGKQVPRFNPFAKSS